MSVELALEEEFARVPLRRKTLGRLLRYLHPHRGRLSIALTIEFLWVVSVSFDPKFVKVAVDGPLASGDAWGTAAIALVLAGVVTLRAAATVWEIREARRIGIDALHALRRDVFDHVQRLSMRYFDRTKQGRIIARADRDVDTVERILLLAPVEFTSLLAAVVVGFVRLAVEYPGLIPFVLAAVPVLWVTTRLFDRFGFPTWRRVRETHAAVSSHVAESVTGVRVIKAFAGEEREAGRLARLQGDYGDAVMKSARASGGLAPALTLSIQALLVVALLLGARRVLGGDMTLGSYVEAVMLVGIVLAPIEGLGLLYNDSLAAGAASERIFLLLDTPSEVRDAPDAVPAGRLAGAVEFDRVSFSYDPADSARRQITDVSFRVEPGERVAIVGRTGAGKTSVLNLLARFYDPQQGAVRFDGADVRSLALPSVHRQMGIVLQENFLFEGSVLENLRFVRPDLTAEEARDGFFALGCADVLGGLDDGLSTEVGERGANLSEGERQIVCFVRALLSRPSIVLLDEATSAVDTRTEAKILDAMRALSSRQTTFVIAHRLSTVRDAERILVLEGGRLVEEGRHDDLLARKGTYARLYAEYAR